MPLEDLRARYSDLGERILGTLKLVLAFLCALAFFWEFGSTPYGQSITANEKNIIDILDYLIIIIFIGKNLILPFLSQDRGNYVWHNFVEILLALILGLFILTSEKAYWEYALIAVKLFAMVVYPYRVLAAWLSRVRVNTPLTMAFSFLTIIVIGMLLFMLPKSTVSGDIKAVDALFTSTSATCVTGLIVKDTGTFFSPFGQAVLLCLIQIGGLGLMTFMAFFSLTLGRGLGLKQEVVMKDALSLEHRFGLRRVVVFILSMTFLVEAVGAVAFYLTFPFPESFSVGQKAWSSIFHSVSAFCNSGFSLFSGSFMSARSFLPLNLVASALIVIGGLGFVVNYNIFRRFRRFLAVVLLVGLGFALFKLFGVLLAVLVMCMLILLARRRLAGVLRRKRRLRPVLPEAGLEKLRQFGVQTKVVIITTVILLAAGTFLVYILESSHSFASFSEGEKWTSSFFQSVTARTAGFNTVDTGALAPATLLVVIVLMFIGASPGSTGGGVKTSTFAMFLLAAVSRLRNRNDVEVFKRTIPQRIIFNGVVVIVLALCVVLISTVILTATEEGANFLGVFFEVVSAFGTVGLSTGITGGLSVAGKVTIIVTMFIGRIGPLTLMLAMSGQEGPKRYEYPDEAIMIG
jgi:trk system potassium uptake protein TrkH